MADTPTPEALGQAEVERDGSFVERAVQAAIDGENIWPKRTVDGFGTFRVRPLSWDAESRCHADARKHVQDVLGLRIQDNLDLCNNEGTVRILYLALMEESSTAKIIKPLAEDLDQWRKFDLLTDLNIALLWTEYEDVKLNQSLSFDAIPDAKKIEIVEALKKNQSMTIVERSPRAHLLDLLSFTVSILTDSTGSASSTSTSSPSAETYSA